MPSPQVVYSLLHQLITVAGVSGQAVAEIGHGVYPPGRGQQLTFFQPDRTLKTADRWQRRLTHSWGPLGSWKGEADYRYEGQPEGLDRVVYDLKVAHQPADASQDAMLPMSSKGTCCNT